MKKLFFFLVFFLTAFIPTNQVVFAADRLDLCTAIVNNASNLTTNSDIKVKFNYPSNAANPYTDHSVQVKSNTNENNVYEKCYPPSSFEGTSFTTLNTDVNGKIQSLQLSAGDYVIQVKQGCSLFDGNACESDKFTIKDASYVPPPLPPNPFKYDCDNRSPKCGKDQYPTCTKFSSSANWKCDVPPNCAMNDTSKQTVSCAYNKDQPPPSTNCSKEGGSCFGTFGSPGQGCCTGTGLICDNPGVGGSIGTGICKTAPSSLGELCNTCLPGDKWDTTKKSCVDSNGNSSTPVSSVYCTITISTCVQGQGCIQMVNTNNDDPAAPPCAEKAADFVLAPSH